LAEWPGRSKSKPKRAEETRSTKGEPEMRAYARIAVAASAAAVLVGLTYLISRQSTAHPSDEQSAPSRIDVFEHMVPAKNLPSERYEIH
jgi:hypothetical protein